MSVTVTREGAVATAWLTRPAVRNAMNQDMARSLRRELDDLAGDAACRVVVVRGVGGHFCAGWDVSDFGAFEDLAVDEMATRLEKNHELLKLIAGLPQVTVAAVEGAAFGFGLGLVASCDFAWASVEAAFCLPEVRFGIVPGSVLVEIQRTVSRKSALDWMLTGRTFGASDALAAGLVSRVIAADEFEAELGRLLASLGEAPAASLLEVKQVFQRTAELPEDEAVRVALGSAAVSARRPGVRQAANRFRSPRAEDA